MQIILLQSVYKSGIMLHEEGGGKMPFRYKIDVVQALKENGYTTYKIRKEKIFSESTLQSFRDNKMVSWETLEQICQLLKVQPGDLLEYVEEDMREG